MSFNAISIGFHVLPVNLEFLRGRQAMMVHRSGSTATEAGTTGGGMMTGQGFDNMLYDTFRRAVLICGGEEIGYVCIFRTAALGRLSTNLCK